VTTDKIEIKGERVKPYVLYGVGLNDEIIQRVAEANSLEELDKVRRRKDWKYRVYHNRKPMPSRRK
jgi:hypothetical protein